MSGYGTGDDRITPFTNYLVQYPLVLAMFFLSCWADPKPTHQDLDGKSFDFISRAVAPQKLEEGWRFYKIFNRISNRAF